MSGEINDLIALFETIGKIAEGSYGLLYLRNDEDKEKYNNFVVHRLARGTVEIYPDTLLSPMIPNVAQIIAVADTFDAMNSTRPYRKKMKMEDIVAELKRVAGTQLNEKYVQVLLTLIKEGKFDE